ncbi:ABC transporter ATP-binding protein [Paenibacillus sp. IB182496]|uniref:ABC transporter ATP-binding protein n=1 Tax=Paenibacillus sabuli TaxID=2772509 RepID=A0A927GTV0_9BACL|nr:ABC transporter ATP-binding protein [Paenibacillus sabuli]MBD2847470.1 ABC transporter ATP-binding protein [Paenibacillus sabuli]
MAKAWKHTGMQGFKDAWTFSLAHTERKKIYALALFLGLGQSFILMLFPLIDNLYFNMLEDQRFNNLRILLLLSTSVVILFLFLILIGEYLKKLILTRTDLNVSWELKYQTQRMPTEQIQALHSSDFVQRIIVDSQRASNFISLIADQLMNQMVMFGLALVYILWLNWQIGAVLLVISPLLLGATHVLRKKVNEIGMQIAEQESVVRTRQQDALQNVEMIKVYCIEDWIVNRCTEERKKLNELYRSRFWWQQLMVLSSSTLIDFIVIGTMVMVGWMALHGSMTIGSLVAFSTLVWRLNQPLKTTAMLWAKMHGDLGGFARIFALLNAEKEPSCIVNDCRPNFEWSLVMQQVDYIYQDSPKLLRNFTLHIAPGTFMAIVGPSGSGKSTIARIAAGLLRPSSGEVMICGNRVHENMEHARQLVSYVPQEPVLFGGSVREQFQMVNHGANQEEIEAAAKLALAHDFIIKLPNQYDTDLKEAGSLLSGGQKQRLSIAQALIADRPIFILDELTSALDVQTEEEVMKNVIHHARSKHLTVIVIAHNLSTIRNADEIVVVDQGCIVQKGKHGELKAQKEELYARMWHGNH